MKRLFITTVALTGLLGLSFSPAKTEDRLIGLNIGDEIVMNDVKMASTDGKAYSLDDMKMENGLIVVFSCNTCPFVVGSENFAGWENKYNDLYKLASDKKIGFVLVNSNEAKRGDEDSMAEMKAHAAKKGYNMKYVVDENSKLANAFGGRTTPHVFFFDKNKKLIYTGAIDNTVDSKRASDDNYLVNAIENYSAGKSLQTAETPPRGCSIKRVS